MDELSTSLSIHHFDNDNENSRRLPNALDGTLFTKRSERFVRNETLWEQTERFHNGTKCFENRTLLRCSSALQGLYSPHINEAKSNLRVCKQNWPSKHLHHDSQCIFKYFEHIFTISLLSPLGEGRGSSFEQTWTPSNQGCFVPSLVEIGSVVLEKKMKMWKVYGQTDRQTDDRRSEKLTWAFSSGELQNTVLQDAYPFTAKYHAKGGETDSFCHKRYFFTFFKKVLNWFF